MNEAFLEVLHRQYFEQISACLQECTHFHESKHNKVVDITKFVKKVSILFVSAKVDGITQDLFREWITEAVPGDLKDHDLHNIDLEEIKKAG